MSLNLYRHRIHNGRMEVQEESSPRTPSPRTSSPRTPSPRTHEQRLINNNWTVVHQEPTTPEVFHENRTRSQLYGSYGTVRRRLFSNETDKLKSHLEKFENLIFDEEKVKNKVDEGVYLQMMNLLKNMHDDL